MNRTTLLFRPALMVGVLSSALLHAGNVVAAHSDIVLEDVVGSKIVLHTDAQPVDFATGNAIFEAEFGESALLPHQTDDPGFVTGATPGPLAAGSAIYYRTLGSLNFWDGTSWGTASSGDRLHIEGNFFEDSIYTGTGVEGDLTGLVGSAASDGTFHEHISAFCIENQALAGCPDNPTEITGNSPSIGAYMVEMVLFGLDAPNGNTLYSDSDPFFLAFNNGLSEVDFEAGIDALTMSPVPVPAAVWLFASGILGLIVVRRQPLDAS